MTNELYHHGVPGMRWGIRKDKKQTNLRIRSGRLNTFGVNGHNILYVAGISGSGKSTLALNLAKKLNAEPIHLDDFYYGQSKKQTPFSKFLKVNGVDLKKIHKDGRLNYEESDKIFPLLKEYSKSRRLIVEGVQLLDETMTTDIKTELANEPVISIQTKAKISFNRAVKRDSATTAKYSDFLKAQRMKEALDNKILLDIGEAYVDSLLESELKKGG